MLTYELARALQADREREIEANVRTRKALRDHRQDLERELAVAADADRGPVRQGVMDGPRTSPTG
jgi:hypothetical protein